MNAPERLRLRGATASRERGERLAFTHQYAQVHQALFLPRQFHRFLHRHTSLARFWARRPKRGRKYLNYKELILESKGFGRRAQNPSSFSMAHGLAPEPSGITPNPRNRPKPNELGHIGFILFFGELARKGRPFPGGLREKLSQQNFDRYSPATVRW